MQSDVADPGEEEKREETDDGEGDQNARQTEQRQGGERRVQRDADEENDQDVAVEDVLAGERFVSFAEDERQTLRQSHNNPQIKALYDEFLGEPNSHKAHELLHTHYNPNRQRFDD